jgi:hypothetical protein
MSFGSLVGLLGQSGSHETNHGLAVGKDIDAIGAVTDFGGELFVEVAGPDLSPPLRKGRGGQDVGSDVGELLVHGGQPVGQRVEVVAYALASGWSQTVCSIVSTTGHTALDVVAMRFAA